MEERTVMEGSGETDQTSDEKLVPVGFKCHLCRKGVIWCCWNGHSAGSGTEGTWLKVWLESRECSGCSMDDGRRMQTADTHCRYWICSLIEEEGMSSGPNQAHGQYLSSTFLHCRVDSIMSPALDHDQVGTATTNSRRGNHKPPTRMTTFPAVSSSTSPAVSPPLPFPRQAAPTC